MTVTLQDIAAISTGPWGGSHHPSPSRNHQVPSPWSDRLRLVDTEECKKPSRNHRLVSELIFMNYNIRFTVLTCRKVSDSGIQNWNHDGCPSNIKNITLTAAGIWCPASTFWEPLQIKKYGSRVLKSSAWKMPTSIQLNNILYVYIYICLYIYKYIYIYIYIMYNIYIYIIWCIMFQLPACDGMFFPKMLPGHLAGSDGSDHPSLPLLLLSMDRKPWNAGGWAQNQR